MTTRDALQSLLNDLAKGAGTKASAQRALAKLGTDPAPVPGPAGPQGPPGPAGGTTTDPGPTPISTPTPGRQPVVAWMGANPLPDEHGVIHFEIRDALTNGVLAALKDAGVAGVTAMRGRYLQSAGITAAEVDVWRQVKAMGFDVLPGFYCIMGSNAQQPFAALDDDAGWSRVNTLVGDMAAKASALGLRGLSLDLENYDGGADGMWNAKTTGVATERAKMRARAESMGLAMRGAGITTVLIYPSSKVGWDDSYQDLVQDQATSPPRDTNYYSTNLGPDFLDGLHDAGLIVQWSNAVFHNGGDESKYVQAIQMDKVRVPYLLEAPMIWVDGPANYTPAQVQTMFEAATRVSTGPVVLYEQSLSTSGLWPQYLAAIKAAASG